MDHTLEYSGFTDKYSNPSTGVRSVFMQPRACSTRVDVAQDSTDFMSRGLKRKWVDLSLGLGASSSSSDSSKQNMGTCCTFSSAATDKADRSSIDLDLTFQFGPCNEGTSKLGTAKRASVQQPVMDLNLSLTVGPAESVVTDMDLNMTAQDDGVALPSCHMATVPTVDEGSTSGRWKSGSKLLPYLLPSISSQSLSGSS
jgi:hypothetical protein